MSGGEEELILNFFKDLLIFWQRKIIISSFKSILKKISNFFLKKIKKYYSNIFKHILKPAN
jgi:hypothetical protein